ncbi:MAG: D-alanyl-D-alanine carboxypeptidase family protein [Polyangiaceae bacterium]|nr:D-alanyl-D-alanine carboxypeptidase family protein [Polyangiaceae bacterium]
MGKSNNHGRDGMVCAQLALLSMLRVSCFGTGVFFCTSLLVGCEPPHDHEPDGPEPLGEAVSAISVQEAMNGSCSTVSVKGLSLQIIAQSACIAPGSFVEVPAEPNIHFSNTVLPYLEQPAKDALVAALQGSPGMDLHVNSMLRTVAQQYLLYQWYLNGLCGIPLAATPGNSNHETGLALDVDEYTAWKSALTANGFKWYGSADPYHYDYVGPGAVNYKGTDVLAFQMLWNKNHPEDLIAEDGDYGPQTEARLKQSPADGFPKGPDCAEKPPKPDIQLTLTMLDADDTFTDGASKDRIDLFQTREYTLEITASNTGNAPADNVELGITMPGPYVLANDYLIETDFGHPGTFEENDANTDPLNPAHQTPLGNEITFKLNAFSKGETKRITLPVLSGDPSLESEISPDIQLWVKDIPGAYHQETFDGPADNIENSQTFNGGSLQLPLGIDVYHPTRWEWNTNRREGWESTNSGVVVAKPDFGVLSVSLPDNTAFDGPLAVGPVLNVSADELTGFEISGRTDAGTLTVREAPAGTTSTMARVVWISIAENPCAAAIYPADLPRMKLPIGCG